MAIRSMVILYILLSAAIFFSVPINADFGFPDAGRHAMNGVFYYDLIKDAGVLKPVSYAIKYYQRYPAIAPLIYPPFFSLCEALMFAVLGIYPWVARLTVMLFLAWGAFGVARLAAYVITEEGARYAGLMYLSIPLVIYWGREVMLEVPATALIIWSLVFFLNYLKEGRGRNIAICLIFAFLAIFTRQTAAFLFPVLLLTAMVMGRFKIAVNRRSIPWIAMSGLLLFLLGYITLKWNMVNVRQAVGILRIGNISSLVNHLLFHIKILPESMGMPILIMACAGAVLLCIKKFRDSIKSRDFNLGVTLIIIYCIICYTQQAFAVRSPRYGFFLMPILAIISSVPICWCLRRSLIKNSARICSIILLICVFAGSLTSLRTNWCEGFYEPAQYLKHHWEGSAILIDIHIDAPLIFHLRALDKNKHFRIYRSEKIFESMKIFKSWGVKSFIESEKELFDALSAYGIRYVFLERNMLNQSRVDKLLGEAVKTNNFEKVKHFIVYYEGNRPKYLYLYRYKKDIAAVGAIPPMHLPIINMEIPGEAARVK